VSQDQDLVDGYTLINMIGGGNSSQVWEVSEKDSATRYAMKFLLPEALADKERVRTLKQEAKIGSSFDHPNLVKFHTVVATKKHAYLIMDYFRAPNVKAQINSDIVQVQVRIRKLVEGVCQALAYIHEKGWVHRDIKPENILLNKGSEVRLVDFSLSTRAAGALSKMAGKVKVIQGTRTYLAPETIRRQKPTIQTDMYSFGVTLYEFLTGGPPFRGGTPDELLQKHLAVVPHAPSWVNPNVSKDTDEFVLRLLAKKPSERPANMEEIAVGFRSLKVFEEDVAEIADRKKKEDEVRKKEELDKPDSILDSRADAERTRLGVKAPKRAPKKVPGKPPAEPAPKKSEPAPAQPAAEQPAPPPQQMPQPQMPQQPPGYGAYPQPAPTAYPGMPYGAPAYPPGQVPPGQPVPPGMPGQAPYYPPQQPAAYPQPPAAPMPQPQAPQQPHPPAAQPQPPAPQPAPPQPAAGAPAQPQPPAQQPQQPAPPQSQPSPAEDNDMPLMDELPPIS